MSKATSDKWVTLVVARDEDGFKKVFRAPGIENFTEGDFAYTEANTANGVRRKLFEVVSAETFGMAYSELKFILSLPGFKGDIESVPALTGRAYMNEYDEDNECEEGGDDDGE